MSGVSAMRWTAVRRRAATAMAAAWMSPGLALAISRGGPATSEPPPVTGVGSVFLALLLVVALIVGAAWLMRRMGGFQVGASGNLRVIGGLAMGARERVVLIQVGDTQLLVGVAPGRIQTLHVLDKPLPSAPSAPVSGSFADRLAGLLQQGRRP